MSENRNEHMGRNQDGDNQQNTSGLQGSDMGNTRSSEGLGGQGQRSDMEGEGQRQDTSGGQQNLGRSSVADYGSSGQPLDSGDAGRGGSAGSGRTDTGGMDDMDDEGMGHNRNGAGGM
jgi:hypothetical protein